MSHSSAPSMNMKQNSQLSRNKAKSVVDKKGNVEAFVVVPISNKLGKAPIYNTITDGGSTAPLYC